MKGADPDCFTTREMIPEPAQKLLSINLACDSITPGAELRDLMYDSLVMEPRIRYAKAEDGVSIAFAVAPSLLLHPSFWIT